MTPSSLFFCLIVILSFVHVFSRVPPSDIGFTVDIIHRDSPLSPLYNSSATKFDLLRNAIHRSISRSRHFTKLFDPTSIKDQIQSEIIPSGGEYFMEVSVGTPPVKVLGIADTGSDLTWTQCKPCVQCYEQKISLFDPKKSTTYKDLSCDSDSCNALNSNERRCEVNKNTCAYSYSYGDRSFTKGQIATEKFRIGSTKGFSVSIPNIVFGCGHNNGGTFDGFGSGIVGLGGGSLSLVSQLSDSINGKFSYCLMPEGSGSNVTSKISFGANSIVSGPKVVSTPLIDKEPSTYYYLTLEGISVGKNRLAYSPDFPMSEIEDGNIIIDSGTTLTLLSSGFYEKLASALEETVQVERVSDPNGLLNVCFKAEGGNIDLPIITLHFKGGANLELQPHHTFAAVEENMVCFTMIPSNDVSIVGNLAQIDFLIGYDLKEKKVSFKKTDCTKHK
ncbi:hypothetical protein ACFE04_001385 [Oxalis oulophora]